MERVRENKGGVNWGEKLKGMGILWQHDGDMSKPHALWTSGRHADTFNNGIKLVESPQMLAEVAFGMINQLRPLMGDSLPNYVVGPAMGAVTLGHEVARQLGTKFAFTEPVMIDGVKMQELKRFDIKAGDTVLVVEDALSTGGSMVKTINVLEEIGVNVLPYVATVVNWSGSDMLGKRRVVSLYSGTPQSWEADECPLCDGGSEPLRPKDNWDEFIK